MSETAFVPHKKPCVRCGEYKPLHDFAVRAGSDDVRRGICKDCHNERQRELYRLRNPKRPRTVKNRTCRSCGVRMPISEFEGSWICTGCKSVGGYQPPRIRYPRGLSGRIKQIAQWSPDEVDDVFRQLDNVG